MSIENELCNEKKLYIRYMMYGDLIKKYVEEELSRLNKRLSVQQTISVINKALELDKITELEINSIIFKEIRNEK